MPGLTMASPCDAISFSITALGTTFGELLRQGAHETKGLGVSVIIVKGNEPMALGEEKRQ